jgi:hypothetical protein
VASVTAQSRIGPPTASPAFLAPHLPGDVVNVDIGHDLPEIVRKVISTDIAPLA